LPKNKVEAPKRELTKRQLTHRQRQNRVQRFTLWGGIGLIAAVIVLVGVGLYFSNIRPTQRTIFKVGNTTYNTGYLADSMDFFGRLNYPFFKNYATYENYISYIGDSVATTIKQNQIYKEAAAAFDPPIKVTDDEVDSYIKENKLLKNKATRDGVYGILLDTKLSDKYKAVWTAKGPVEQRAVLAMFVESQSEVDNVTSRIAKGETFNAIAEGESLDSVTKSKSGDLGWVVKGVIPTLVNDASDTILDELVFADSTQVNVLAQKADPTKSKSKGYWLVQVTDYKSVAETGAATAESNANNTAEAKVNVMLLGSREIALDMKKQLENGADFATLAKANSQYTDAATDGGILDYTKKGTLGDAVDAILFPADSTTQLPVGRVSEIITDTRSTNGGFWLTQVTGIEPKIVDGDNLNTLSTIDKNDWKDTAWTAKSDTIVDQMDADKTTWAAQQAIKRYNGK
jgi:parvulin-like peptidyl-prolyl isomerase